MTILKVEVKVMHNSTVNISLITEVINITIAITGNTVLSIGIFTF